MHLKNDWRSKPYRPLLKSIALQMTSFHVTDRPNQFLAILCHRESLMHRYLFCPHLNRSPFSRCSSVRTVNFASICCLKRPSATPKSAVANLSEVNSNGDDFVSAVDYCLNCVARFLMVLLHQMQTPNRMTEDCMEQSDYSNLIANYSPMWLDCCCCYLLMRAMATSANGLNSAQRRLDAVQPMPVEH